MKVVVDSNIVFSAMLNPESSIGDIILNSQDTFTFYGCEYLREEINDLKDKIIKIARYDEREYDEVEFLVYKQVDFFSESTIPFEFWQQAADFVRDVERNIEIARQMKSEGEPVDKIVRLTGLTAEEIGKL